MATPPDDSPSDFDLADEELAKILYLIGLVVAAWAELDDYLIRLLARLIGCKPKAAGIIYYALDAFSTRFAVINGLAQHKLKVSKKRTELLGFLKRLNKLATTRNNMIHAVYHKVYTPDSGKTVIRKAVFRSKLETLHQETLAQTGELETHLNLLAGARLWLFLSGWTTSKGGRLSSADRARIMALKTEVAKSSKSND